jgi:hypothetical protein
MKAASDKIEEAARKAAAVLGHQLMDSKDVVVADGRAELAAQLDQQLNTIVRQNVEIVTALRQKTSAEERFLLMEQRAKIFFVAFKGMLDRYQYALDQLRAFHAVALQVKQASRQRRSGGSVASKLAAASSLFDTATLVQGASMGLFSASSGDVHLIDAFNALQLEDNKTVHALRDTSFAGLPSPADIEQQVKLLNDELNQLAEEEQKKLHGDLHGIQAVRLMIEKQSKPQLLLLSEEKQMRLQTKAVRLLKGPETAEAKVLGEFPALTFNVSGRARAQAGGIPIEYSDDEEEDEEVEATTASTAAAVILTMQRTFTARPYSQYRSFLSVYQFLEEGKFTLPELAKRSDASDKDSPCLSFGNLLTDIPESFVLRTRVLPVVAVTLGMQGPQHDKELHAIHMPPLGEVKKCKQLLLYLAGSQSASRLLAAQMAAEAAFADVADGDVCIDHCIPAPLLRRTAAFIELEACARKVLEHYLLFKADRTRPYHLLYACMYMSAVAHTLNNHVLRDRDDYCYLPMLVRKWREWFDVWRKLVLADNEAPEWQVALARLEPGQQLEGDLPPTQPLLGNVAMIILERKIAAEVRVGST